MSSDACAFAVTQISNQFACEYGKLVTRRAGPDISCQSDQMCARCNRVHEHFKRVGLSAFDFADDLNEVPHGTWLKIQFGGLLGMQAELGLQGDAENIRNIAAVIEQAEHAFSSIDAFPYENLVPAMQSYKTKRRRGK